MGKATVVARVVLQRKNILDLNDFHASLHDAYRELLGKRVSLQLVSSVNTESTDGTAPRIGTPAYLQDWPKLPDANPVGDKIFQVSFDWDEEFGTPGAFLIKNHHKGEFYLKSVTLEDVPPGTGKSIHFVCNSWVYNVDKYKYDRVFFSNQSYLPSETPTPLKVLREAELQHLRGDGKGQLQEWDRVYDYAFYNDLGNPDKGNDYVRPILGGSKEYPYPRRGRTGRPPSKSDPNTETRLSLVSGEIYVPRDERFGHVKVSDILAYNLKSIVQILIPEFKSLFDKTPGEFDTFQDILNLYEGGIKLPSTPSIDAIKQKIPMELLKELVRTNGERFLKFPTPQVIQYDKNAWRTDEEFAREMLAGIDPVVIRRLEEFPPKSNLDPEVYGPQGSTMTADHAEKFLDGLTIHEALEKDRLFILDHHDAFMPYLSRILSSTSNKIYASRTLLFLKDDGRLAPLAIELSLPNPNGPQHGAVSKVYTPAGDGVEASLWQLAKTYVATADSGYHQLISHWLNTHCAIEPFVIATHRQLSSMHPIYKLLHPHFRDTMGMNALARQILIGSGDLVEKNFFPGKFSMEMSSVAYKSWVFTEQGLPADLLKRGMAVPDSSEPHGLRLLIQDYPYAVDGLQIWSAIRTWVQEYCSIYYESDHVIRSDTELQAWWHEVRSVGHGDKKDEPWWPKMETLDELVESLTTIIWVASALHAALNFGQYSYTGYVPTRPNSTRRLMPEPGSEEYAELETDPDSVFLKTIPSQLHSLIGISVIEVLSRHPSDEVYLGQMIDQNWTAEEKAVAAFHRFGDKLLEIENRITSMNEESEKWKNRTGPVRVPYTLLFPNTSDLSGIGGLTGKGIPNSVSI